MLCTQFIRLSIDERSKAAKNSLLLRSKCRQHAMTSLKFSLAFWVIEKLKSHSIERQHDFERSVQTNITSNRTDSVTLLRSVVVKTKREMLLFHRHWKWIMKLCQQACSLIKVENFMWNRVYWNRLKVHSWKNYPLLWHEMKWNVTKGVIN